MKSISALLGRSKDLIRYFLASIISTIATLLLNPFVAVNMAKEDYAITGYYTSFNLLILPLVGFSFLQYYNKSYYRVVKDKRQTMLNTLLSSQIIFGLIALAVILGAFHLYHKTNIISIPYFPYAILFFASVYFSQSYSFYQAKLKFEKNSKKFLNLAIFYTLIHALTIVVFVIFMKKGALGYALATIVTSIIPSIYAIAKTQTAFIIEKSVLRDALKFCWPLILANIMEYVFSGIDRSFLVGLKDNDQLGIYNIAVTMGTYVTIFYTAISQTFQPDLFEAVSKKDEKGTWRIVGKIQILNIIPIVLFIIFAPLIIRILTMGRYVDSAPFARIIALKGIFAAFYFSLSSIIIAGGLSKVSLLNKTIGTFFVYFLFKYLISNYAYMGAAWGQALSYVIMIVITLVFIVFNRKKIFL